MISNHHPVIRICICVFFIFVQVNSVLDERPCLRSSGGHLILESQNGRNITLQATGGFVTVNGMDVSQAFSLVQSVKSALITLNTTPLNFLLSNLTTVVQTLSSEARFVRQINDLTNSMSSASVNISTLQTSMRNVQHNLTTSIERLNDGLLTPEKNRLIANISRIVNEMLVDGGQSIGGTGISDSVVRNIRRRLTTVEARGPVISSIIENVQDIQLRLNQTSSSTSSTTPAVRRSIRRINARIRALSRIVNLVKRRVLRRRCNTDPCHHGGTCIDTTTPIGYVCICPVGWEGTSCNEDTNECYTFLGTDLGCQNGATCINSPGTYSCQCASGWHGVHCTSKEDSCSAGSSMEVCGHGTCIPTARGGHSYSCICDQGYKSSPMSPACLQDVDECAGDNHPCSKDPPVRCINSYGSFTCGQCPQGYEGNGFYCRDIDECAINNGGCSLYPRVDCINTRPFRRCGSCPAGYIGDGVTCTSSGGPCQTNPCHPMATCYDNPAMSASYYTCTCRPGYQGNGMGSNGCQLIPGGQPESNPCNPNPCLQGTCTVAGTQFQCTCHSGYTGTTCNIHSDSCASSPCLNGGSCTNADQGYLCFCPVAYTGERCDTPTQECGGTLTGSGGMVAYPVENVRYNHNITCTWVITVAQNKAINITFTEFHLEGALPRCSYDWVQIHDGPSVSSSLMGKYCENVKPGLNGTIISSGNNIYIWFRTDQSISGDGFKLIWNITEPGCGGMKIGTDFGTINSPGYPGRYSHNQDCHWVVKVQLGMKIQFSFATLQLEHHPNCSYDFLEIRDGLVASSPVLERYCSSQSVPAPLITSGSEAWIYFHSDEDTSDTGFHITYASQPGIPGCGGLLTNTEGEFSVPRVNGRYQRNMVCEWLIRVHPHERIELNFTSFNLEHHSTCRFDVVTVHDGSDTNSPLLGRYCSDDLPEILMSNSNEMTIFFKSDGGIQYEGFDARYRVACGGQYGGDTGAIFSPYFPHRYPHSRICLYTILQDVGKAIVLNFTSFDIEGPNGTCPFDYVEVRDGNRGSAEVIGKYCGGPQHLPPLIVSSLNALWIIFKTDGSQANHGFYATYSTVDIACGGILHTLSGTISSPNQPDRYMHNHDCRWIIDVPSDYVVQLTWHMFALEGSGLCRYDYVEVFDNSTVPGTNGVIGGRKYCGTRLPPVMTSMGNIVTIHFHSDESVNHDGFSLTYHALHTDTACGGSYHSPNGYIQSPLYPLGYPSSRECRWTINVKPHHQIRLNFTLLDLEGRENRCYDYVEIRNGLLASSPLLQKVCGRNSTVGTIYSHSNHLYIKFVSDRSVQYRGFHLFWDETATGCGGTMTSSTGEFMSPGYPQSLYSRTMCYWTIRVNKGSKIRLNILDLDISPCFSNYIEIRDGPYPSSRLLGRHCSNQGFISINSSSNSLWIKFRGDYAHSTSRGFRATYVTDCNVDVTASFGVIESPSFPYNYQNNRNCTWTIKASRGNSINASFSHFDVEDRASPDAALCEYDFVEARAGNRDSVSRTVLGHFCGSNNPPALYSGKGMDIMEIQFQSDWIVNHNGFRMEYMVTGCGGLYQDQSGTFTSPNYPNAYPVNTDCEWHLEVFPGQRIQITLNEYDIESSFSQSNCMFDSLNIYGGPDTSSPRIGHYCHHLSSPVSVTTQGHKALVKLISDGSVKGRGFSASYTAITGGCGGVFTGNSGEIHSPNFPNNYDPNSDCLWYIYVDKNHIVELNFTDFGVETHHNCSYDNVTVYDGPSMAYPSLLSYCGMTLPSPHVLRSTANSLTVRLKTDVTVGASGFKAIFKAGCGATLNASIEDQSSSFSSPGFPNLFTYATNCTWHIQAPEGYKVRLQFTNLHIEQRSYMPNPLNRTCPQGSVTLYNGLHANSESIKIGEYCGSHIPLPSVSSDRYMTVHLQSFMGIGSGFRALYTSVDTDCGGELSSMSGEIASPNYPASYPASYDCIWKIKAGDGNKVQLSFEIFDLETSDNCNLDYVEVHAINGEGPLLLHNCSSTIPSRVTATDSLWIRFRSDAVGTANGFLATYSVVQGNEIFKNSGVISSPLYPQQFVTRGDYDYIITVDQGKFISIMLTNMAVEVDPYADVCLSSVNIYDGSTDQHPLLGTYCGYLPVSRPIGSSGNNVLIRFHSAFQHEGSRFRLTYRSVTERVTKDEQITTSGFNTNCRYHIMLNNTARIRSPNYPNNYNNSMKCEWIIQTDPGFKIRLYTGSIKLEQSQNCVYDKVEVFDGVDGTMSWNKTGTLCNRIHGYKIFSSSGSYLRVTFIADSVQTERGFSMTLRKRCGGVLSGSRGVIKTTSSFWSNRCTWKIMVRSSRTIKITFTKFKIFNTTTGCEQNYLLAYNGPTASSPFLGNGRYCGTQIPTLPETSSNNALLRYSVRYSRNTDKGIRLEYEELGSDCGGEYHLSSSSSEIIINSPNYPNPAHPHTECIWIITATQGKILTMNFIENFDITTSGFRRTCDKAFVEVRDGGTPMSSLIGKFCGKTIPNTLGSKDNTVFIRYYTDADTVHSGFKLKISLDACGGTYQIRTGYLPSPGYPNNYGPNLNCSWNVLGPTGHYLTFDFSEVKIPTRTSNCSNSGLTIQDNKMANVSTTVCGNMQPDPFDSASSNTTITFHSGAQLPKGDKKFRMFINTSTEECGGTFTGTGGTIYSPGYPHGVTHIWGCQYKLIGPVGTRIQAIVEDFDVSRESFCYFQLSFYNGLETNVYLSGYGCYRSSYSTRPPMNSSMNTMLVTLHARQNSGRGFKIRWTADQPQECGGIMSGRNGTFHSPGRENGGYSHRMNCEWVFENGLPSTSSLNLTLTYKHLEGRCFDYIIIESELPSGEKITSTKICEESNTTSFIIPFPIVKVTFITDISVNKTGFNFTYSYINCGGYFADGPSYIATPNAPSNYPANSQCAWVFNYPVGSQVEFNFTSFTLEDSLNHDFVKIYNGLSPLSPMIAHYSGSSRENVMSQSHQMFVLFQSDSSNSAKGFNATVFAHTRGCGGIFHRMRGSLASPGFHRAVDYPENVECAWTIHIKPGYHLRLSFKEMFDLETSVNCANDFVQISQPSATTVSRSYENEPKLCGKQMPSDFNATSSRVKVLFRSNDDIQGRGFKIQWFGVCGGYYTDPEGTIISPNHPLPFPRYMRCTYHIPVTAGGYITLNFTAMNIPRCRFNYIVINEHYHGQNWRNRTLCGNEVPDPILLRGETIITFKSGWYTQQATGFALTYKIEECGGNITEPGDIKVPSPNNRYTNSMDCEWDITAPVGKVIVIKFQSLVIENHPECQYDYLNIYRGHQIAEDKLLSTFCGDHTLDLPILTTNTSTAKVKFVTDRFIASGNFKATVQFIQACGSNIILPNAEDSRTIRSPDSDNDGSYEPFLACTWSVVGNDNMVLSMNLSRLEIEGPTENDTLPCPYDYVKVYDGPSINSPLLTMLCGTTLPAQAIVGTRNVMTIRFHSDSQEQLSGFTALVQNKPRLCGGTFVATDTPQSIESPGFAVGYPNSARCYWGIQAPSENQTIRVDVNTINIEQSFKCRKDYLHIFESDDSHRIINAGVHTLQINGTRYTFPGSNKWNLYYCGTTIPKHHQTTTNKLNLIFNSDISGTAPGFRLHFYISTCNRTYSGTSGVIRNPPNSRECYTTITAPQGKYISLYITGLYTLDRETNGIIFKVYDGASTTETVLADYSTVVRPMPPVFSTGSNMYLKVVQPRNNLRYLLYYAISDAPKGCGGMFFGTLMYFTSPNYPNSPTANRTCAYKLRVPEPHHLYLGFLRWDFTNGGNCSTTYLKVTNINPSGDVGTSTIYCEQDRPQSSMAIGSMSLVEFVVGPEGINGTGWTALFAALLPHQDPSELDASFSTVSTDTTTS